MKTLKIVNGLVPDYKEKKLIQKDVYIQDGKIAELGVVYKDAEKTIDADGKIVSPGFIDIHMHEETIDYEEKDPYFTAYYELKMGVTTCIGGNCGNNRQSVSEFKGYIDKYGSPVNYMSFIGHNYLRESVGSDDRYRGSTGIEIEKMQKKISEELDNGIIGMALNIHLESLMKKLLTLPKDLIQMSIYCLHTLGKMVKKV